MGHQNIRKKNNIELITIKVRIVVPLAGRTVFGKRQIEGSCGTGKNLASSTGGDIHFNNCTTCCVTLIIHFKIKLCG